MNNPPSIQEYVDSLDYDQLENLIEKANRKKSQKDSEKKVWVHQVTTHTVCKNFKTEDIVGAAKFIGDKVMEIANAEEKLSEKIYQMKQVGLNSFKVHESEYNSWFD